VTDTRLRTEQADDRDAIAAVVTAAFGSEAEARLVDAIRRSENFVRDWSVVAERAGSIIGHVMVSYVGLHDGARIRRIPSLSPLAVAPPFQRQGVGRALVHEVIARVDEAGEPLVVLEGSPWYYAKCGFEPARPLGISIALPDWAPDGADQVRRLHAYDPAVRGHVEYPAAFRTIDER
jgi:putative acetyltransferase